MFIYLSIYKLFPHFFQTFSTLVNTLKSNVILDTLCVLHALHIKKKKTHNTNIDAH